MEDGSVGRIRYNRPITLGSGERDKHNLIGHTLLFTIGDLKILLDPGRTKVESPKAETVVPENVDFILLTHAHGDHAGNLRIAMKLSPGARIYATAPTKALLSSRLFPDQLEKIVEVEYGEEIDLGRRVVARPIHAGHIIGSASWVISAPEGNFLFTGDFSTEDRGVIAPFRRPDLDLRGLISEASLVKYPPMYILPAEEEQARVGFAVASAIAAKKSVVVAADNVDALHEIALLMVLWQRDRQLPVFPIYTSSVLERGFAVYLHYYDTLPLASRLPRIQPNTFRQLSDMPDLAMAEAFCYFAGPASLKPPFPLAAVQQILRHGGHLIGQSHKEDRMLKRVTGGGGVSLAPDQATLVNIPSHNSEPALKNAICEMRPREVVFVHGNSTDLMRFGAELPCPVRLPSGSKRPL